MSVTTRARSAGTKSATARRVDFAERGAAGREARDAAVGVEREQREVEPRQLGRRRSAKNAASSRSYSAAARTASRAAAARKWSWCAATG